MELMNKLFEAAKANKQRIVLPEGEEQRTIIATEEIKNQAAKDIEDMKKKAELEAKEHIAELAIVAAEKIIEKGDTYDEGSSK